MQRKKTNLKTQMKLSAKTPIKTKKEYDGDFGIITSTGSTLLDLAISGGRVRGGGIPGGILIEIFGPSGAGKTVLLSEIAGNISRNGGSIMFHDPEARLDKTFAQLFGLKLDTIEYTQPDTVTEVFSQVRAWAPEQNKKINGVFADSLAALSTDLEMENKDGDKMGMRRAKEFSEQLRKTCRVLAQKNWIMACSNQVRTNTDAGLYGEKHTTPGGVSVGFYSSLRLRLRTPVKIRNKVKIAGKEHSRVVGIQVEVEVYKSSIWKPYRTAPISIFFDYGIDDIRANLQYIKGMTTNTTYTLNGEKLAVSLDDSIRMIEERNLEKELREAVIDLWITVEAKFETERKTKERI